MKFRFVSAAAVSAAVMLAAGCGSAPVQTTAIPLTAAESSAPAEQSETSPAAESSTPAEQSVTDIVNNSLFHIGSSERFKKAFDKAKNGETITVAYIGGSITEGYTLQPDQCWAYLTHKYLCEKYPDAVINYVNAGLSGTPSSLGLIRAERDVIAPHGEPDIVFIEFAVNDAQDRIDKEAYESLVRKMLLLDSQPAVALVFMRTDTGYSCQKQQSEIGLHYNLPMISVNDALTLAIDNGHMSWADYANDGAHPNPDGSRLIAQMVELMLDVQAGDVTVDRSSDDTDVPVDPALTEPLFSGEFTDMHIIDSESLSPASIGEYSEKNVLAAFPNGWMRKGGENEGIRFDMMFDDLFLVYHCNNNKRFGTANVYVDGELKAEIVSNSSSGWSNPVPKLIMRGDGDMKHTVEIKMKEGSEKDYFAILAFGYTD